MEKKYTVYEEIKILKKATKDENIVSSISPVIAISFGVIPIKSDPKRLVLATVNNINPHCQNILTKLLKKEVVLELFEEAVVYSFLTTTYLQKYSVNHNTFLSEDFLEQKENYPFLAKHKKDKTGDSINRLPRTKIAFVDISFHSLLKNLDNPNSVVNFQSSKPEIPFKVIEGIPEIYSQEMIDSNTSIFLKQSFKYEGIEFNNGVLGKEISKLPHIIHPTEIQLTSIYEDGSIDFYIHDRIKHANSGKEQLWKVKYHFLSFGNRFQRELTLKVNDLRIFSKDEIIFRKDEPIWNAKDLERWLGFDVYPFKGRKINLT